MMIVGERVVLMTSRAAWGEGGVRAVPKLVEGVLAEVRRKDGYMVVKLQDGRVFEKPEIYDDPWTQVLPVRTVIETRSPEAPALSEEPAPQSVQEWINECNRIERENGEAYDQPRLPSGWWILPCLLIGAFVVAFIASRLITGAIE